jgi:uncharacterized protein with HEPN domain
MLQFAREAQTFVAGRTRADYDADLALRRAVERATELIGEAASNISESTTNRHPEIPWRNIIGQRHVLIHGYGDVDDDLVWNLTRDEIPTLVVILESILSEAEPGE